jgi:hypothetical protein
VGADSALSVTVVCGGPTPPCAQTSCGCCGNNCALLCLNEWLSRSCPRNTGWLTQSRPFSFAPQSRRAALERFLSWRRPSTARCQFVGWCCTHLAGDRAGRRETSGPVSMSSAPP